MTYEELLKTVITGEMIRIIYSKPTNDKLLAKVRVRPIMLKNQLMYQLTKSIGNKETNTIKEIHANFTSEELYHELVRLVPDQFLQVLIETTSVGYTVLANRKGTVTIRKNSKVEERPRGIQEHNRIKEYIIAEGTKVPFMQDLGVMTKEGKVVQAKYDKFRQINRYLEFVEDILPSLPKAKINIVDFGCGKSYLTFALYYYLVELQKIPAHIIGLDLKDDVIRECNRLKDKYGYRDLEFLTGDIGNFATTQKINMVVTLHACDTATDYAIYKALQWEADVIMAVPCCQHELNRTIQASVLDGALQYGIIKERISALLTDSIRANILTECGYSTQILEFIDMEHTPKNILIRATKGRNMKPRMAKDLAGQLERMTGTELTLRRLLNQEDCR